MSLQIRRKVKLPRNRTLASQLCTPPHNKRVYTMYAWYLRKSIDEMDTQPVDAEDDDIPDLDPEDMPLS